MRRRTVWLMSVIAAIFLMSKCYHKINSDNTETAQSAIQQTQPAGKRKSYMVGTYDVSKFQGKIYSDVNYGANINGNNQQQQLAMDIYQPPGFSSHKKYPFVLLIHGGGFLTGTKKALGGMAAQLANNGYVSASIDYRLGWLRLTDNGTGCGDSTSFKLAVLKAIQDAKASMRFTVKNAKKYGIDTSKMFIGGASAGAVTAWYSVYLTDQNINGLFPEYKPADGDINASTNDIKANYTVKGIISMWGGFGDVNYITKDNAIPAVFFHGKKDHTAPFDYGYINNCSGFVQSYGALPLYNKLKDLHVLAIAHVDPEGGHGVFTPDFRLQNTLCFLNDVLTGTKEDEYMEGIKNSCTKPYVK